VIATDLGDELVVLDPARGEMFSLNETGRCIWQAIERGDEEPVAALVAAFAVDVEEARADVEALTSALVAAGLLERAGTSDGQDR
jgi:hypothetical protein